MLCWRGYTLQVHAISKLGHGLQVDDQLERRESLNGHLNEIKARGLRWFLFAPRRRIGSV